MTRTITTAILSFLLALASPTPAAAQAPSTPPPRITETALPQLVGRVVRIVYRDRHSVFAPVQKQDADTITLSGMPPDRLSDILTIDVAERPVDVGIKGLLVGAAIGVAVTKGQSKAVPISTAAFGGFLGAVKTFFNPNYERITINQPKELTMVPTATLHSIGVSGRVVW